jgi:hypothetical protein
MNEQDPEDLTEAAQTIRADATKPITPPVTAPESFRGRRVTAEELTRWLCDMDAPRAQRARKAAKAIKELQMYDPHLIVVRPSN